MNVPTRRPLIAAALAAGLCLLALTACGSPDANDVGVAADGAVDLPPVSYDASGDPVGLEHYRRWSEHVRQGAQPGGDEAFRNLAALGVTTVISVDGARPDLEAAARHGLRYVHVPIGYDGLTREQQLRIVKAAATSKGAVYVHCHHGKHRGPAGSMVVLMALEGIDHETALVRLEESGCSPKYAGLYRDTAAFVVPTEAELAAVPDDLPSYVAPAALVDAMLDVDLRAEHLKASEEADWGVPPGSPDVSPPHEARMLFEHFREMARLDESRDLGERFVALLGEAEASARALESALRTGDGAAADAAWKSTRESCGTCHDGYRNTR